MAKYKYCPLCGVEASYKSGVLSCKNDHTVYFHSSATSSVFVIKDDKVLLALRKFDPKKGTLDSVGGFVNYGEHPRDAARRETLEETNLKIQILYELPVNMDSYAYQGQEIPTLNFAYIAKIKSGKMEIKDDVADLIWFDINKIPFNKVGFDTIKINLKQIQKWWKENN